MDLPIYLKIKVFSINIYSWWISLFKY